MTMFFCKEVYKFLLYILKEKTCNSASCKNIKVKKKDENMSLNLNPTKIIYMVHNICKDISVLCVFIAHLLINMTVF